jgi:hypothetical protein
MAFLSEAQLETALLEQLAALGYARTADDLVGPDGRQPEREAYDEVVLKARLTAAVARLNPTLPPEAQADAMRRLTQSELPNLLEENRRIHRLLTEGADVEFYGDDGVLTAGKVRLIDFERPANNDWLAVQQFTVIAGQVKRRPDVGGFINGLPLAVIELKAPGGENATLAAQLDLVAIDFVQRESHRHAHWLLPAVHWLERDDLLAFTSNMHDEPYLQYGAKAVEPPPGTRQEWRIFVDLAIAMRKPLFGAKGLNGFIGATRRAAQLTRRPGLEFSPHWIDRLVVATGRRFNGRRIRWRDVMAHPHGWVLGPREFGHFREALRTPDTKVRIAPPEFLARARELLAEPAARPP